MVSSKQLACVLLAGFVWGVVGCREAEDGASASRDVTPEAPAPVPEASPPPKVKASLPEDVPDYPDGNVLLSRASGDQGVSVRFETDDPVAEVADFYAKSLAEEGWKTENRAAVGGAAVFANKGKRRAAISVSQSAEGKTQVDVMIAKQPF